MKSKSGSAGIQRERSREDESRHSYQSGKIYEEKIGKAFSSIQLQLGQTATVENSKGAIQETFQKVVNPMG